MKQFGFDGAVRFISDELPGMQTALFRGGEGLRRAEAFFELLGNPQERFKTVHVAGTSGKGTVCYMIEALLGDAGFSTGLHLSPHVYDIRERCMLNGKLPPKHVFAKLISDELPAIRQMSEGAFGAPSYFEATVGAAFTLFAQQEVDYAIVETGLGGLYDATNTIERSDRLAIITTLGLDHTEILGDSLDKIAAQKAGILPHGGEAIVLRPDDAAAGRVFAEMATSRETSLQIVSADIYTVTATSPKTTFDYHDGERRISDIMLSLPGEHHVQDAALALKTLFFLAERDGFRLPSDERIRQILGSLRLPGRMERHRRFDRSIIFDGAHNPQKMAALLSALPLTPQPVCVLALKKTKDAPAILNQLAAHIDTLVVTEFFSDQEGKGVNVSYPAAELAVIARQAGIAEVIVEPDSDTALEEACRRAAPDQPVLVTGSFYLLGELHKRSKA